MAKYQKFHKVRSQLYLAKLTKKPNTDSSEYEALQKQYDEFKPYALVYQAFDSPNPPILTSDLHANMTAAKELSEQLTDFPSNEIKGLLGDFTPIMVGAASNEASRNQALDKIRAILLVLKRLKHNIGSERYQQFIKFLTKDPDLQNPNQWDTTFLMELYEFSISSDKLQEDFLRILNQQDPELRVDARAIIANYNYSNAVINNWYQSLGYKDYRGTKNSYNKDSVSSSNFLRDQTHRMRLLDQSAEIVEQNEALAVGGNVLLQEVANHQTDNSCYHALDIYQRKEPQYACLHLFFSGQRNEFANRCSREAIEPIMQYVANTLISLIPSDWRLDQDALSKMIWQHVISQLDGWWFESSMSLTDKVTFFKEIVNSALVPVVKEQKANPTPGILVPFKKVETAMQSAGAVLSALANRQCAKHFAKSTQDAATQPSAIVVTACNKQLRDLLASYLRSGRNVSELQQFLKNIKLDSFEPEDRNLYESSLTLSIFSLYLGEQQWSNIFNDPSKMTTLIKNLQAHPEYQSIIDTIAQCDLEYLKLELDQRQIYPQYFQPVFDFVKKLTKSPSDSDSTKAAMDAAFTKAQESLDERLNFTEFFLVN